MSDSDTKTAPKKRGRPATGRKTEAEKMAAIAKSERENLPQFGGRPDDMTMQLLAEGISLMGMPAVDVMQPQQVQERTLLYLKRCAENKRRPAVAAYALYLGIDRRTLNGYYSGVNHAIHPDSLSTIKYIYALIDGAWEQQMTDGAMNVVAGIFLMRNNLGYTNVDTVEIVPKAPEINSADINDVIAQYSDDGENA